MPKDRPAPTPMPDAATHAAAEAAQAVHAVLAPLAGVSLDAARLQQVIDAYAPILEEIRKLRTLDLAEVHPAVIFEPTAPYRRDQ